jgi:hypothetical protein
MATEKRKKDQQRSVQRPFPWLPMLAAFVIGAVAMFVVMTVSTQTVTSSSVQLMVTATPIEVRVLPADIDAAATAIYAQQTQDAFSAQSGTMNEFEITATYVVSEATVQALQAMQETPIPGG